MITGSEDSLFRDKNFNYSNYVSYKKNIYVKLNRIILSKEDYFYLELIKIKKVDRNWIKENILL